MVPAGPAYGTCRSPSEALRALPPGLEGRVQLLRDVPDVLGVSVDAEDASQRSESENDIVLTEILQAHSWRDPYGRVAKGLGGRFSGEQSSAGEGRPSESSLSRWTCREVRKRRRTHVSALKKKETDYKIRDMYGRRSLRHIYRSVSRGPPVVITDRRSVLAPRGRALQLARSSLCLHFLLLHKACNFLAQQTRRWIVPQVAIKT